MLDSRPRNTGAHFVFEELKRQILCLELRPGERVYEPAVAASLQVSRTPVREAVRGLISEGLLQQQPTGGVLVPQLEASEVSELYDVRAALESLMAREACVRATPDDIGELEGIVARNAAMVKFADEAMNHGKSLHAAIARISGNSWAQRFHEQISSQITRYRHFTNSSPARREVALTEHRALVRALAAGTPDDVARIALDHVVGARDEAVRAVTSSNLVIP